MQHKMSRVASGWIPKRAAQDKDEDGDANDEEDDHFMVANRMETATSEGPMPPMGAQRESDEQRQA